VTKEFIRFSVSSVISNIAQLYMESRFSHLVVCRSKYLDKHLNLTQINRLK